MINVITSEPAVVQNPFPGMNLAEACNAVEVAVIEACNDFEMNVLLTEHAYLYANGTEMQYVDEAGELNEKATAIKEKAIELIKFCGEKLRELWDKAIETVTRFMSGVAASLNKASISKTMAYRLADNFVNVLGKKVKVVGVAHTVDKSFFTKYKDYIHSTEYKVEDPKAFYEKFVTKNSDIIEITAEDFKSALDDIFKSTIIKDIKKAKSNAERILKDHIAQIKFIKGDGYDETITNIKATMTSNTRITREAIRVCNVHANTQARIVNAIMRLSPAKTFISGERVKDVKAAPGKAREAAGRAKDSVISGAKAAPGKAANAVANGAKGAVDAVKNAPENVRKHFTKKD